MDFLSYWDKRIEANKRLFDNNPGIANFLFDECQLLYEHMTKESNEHMRDELQELRSQLAESEQRVKALEEALTPNEEAKSAYIMQEFSFIDYTRCVNGLETGHWNVVPWATIQQIMEAIKQRAEACLNGANC